MKITIIIVSTVKRINKVISKKQNLHLFIHNQITPFQIKLPPRLFLVWK